MKSNDALIIDCCPYDDADRVNYMTYCHGTYQGSPAFAPKECSTSYRGIPIFRERAMLPDQGLSKKLV